MSNKEVVRDVRSALQLEQELQLAVNGVAVLDIYSSEWGPCRAIAETFRRLATDQGDGVHLRFLSVECHAVLQSLKQPEDQRNPQRPKNIEAIRDILPEGWQGILEERCGQSKPYFLFYKEGKKSGFVEGVNTPLIRATVKDLCTVKTPASEYITNPRLQEFWEENFNPDESEILLEKFLKGIANSFKYTVPLTDHEKAALVEAIGLPKDAKERIITAEALQKWIGDDEVRTVQSAFLEVLPEYEARAAEVLRKEAEDRKAQEEQRAREAKAEEERKAVEAAAEEERKKAEAAAKAAAVPREETQEQLLAKVPEVASIADAQEDESHAALRQHVADHPLAAPTITQIILHSAESAEKESQETIDSLTNAKTLTGAMLEAGLSLVAINALRSAAHDRFTELHLPTMSKLALLLASGDAAASKKLIGKEIDYRQLLSTQALLTNDVPLAAALMCTAAVECPKVLRTAVPKSAISGFELLVDGATVTIPPFTLLAFEQEGEFAITVHNVPHAILSLSGSMYATHWYLKCAVTSVSESEAVLTYEGLANEEKFLSVATAISTQSNSDEKKFVTLGKIQAAAPPPQQAKPHEAPAEVPPQPQAEAAEPSEPQNQPEEEAAAPEPTAAAEEL